MAFAVSRPLSSPPGLLVSSFVTVTEIFFGKLITNAQCVGALYEHSKYLGKSTLSSSIFPCIRQMTGNEGWDGMETGHVK